MRMRETISALIEVAGYREKLKIRLGEWSQ